MKARGTLNDIAKIVGVSAASVSYAFSRPDQLSSELRGKNPSHSASPQLSGTESCRQDASDRVCRLHRSRLPFSVTPAF